MWRFWLGWLLGIILLNSGCTSFQGGNRMMDAAAKLGDTLAEKIKDQGILDKWTVDVDGNVQDPGIESYIDIKVSSGVRATGVNGRVASQGGGDSTKLPSGMREMLIKQLDQPISDMQRENILAILGWNRKQP